MKKMQEDEQMTDDTINQVALQVMWNRLISIVEEQAQALIRTAFSTSVREAGDLSAGVYDAEGRMLAQAVTGTPGHVNSMAAAVRHFITEIGIDNIAAKDVYITNDPWRGTGHLHDITVVTPVFHADSLVAFFACTAHVVDIGGRGFGADANSVYEEGLFIPIMKLVDRGQVDTTLISLVRANVREPEQVIGDIYALATCNETGERRLLAMLQEFRLRDLVTLAEFILGNSQFATLEAINQLPHGKAYAEMTIDGYHQPILLAVEVEIQKDQIVCDFSNSSAQDKKGINVPLVYTQAYACYALKCAIAPDIPNNAASLAPFKALAPQGSILNAVHPAPVALRHVIGHMIPDTVYIALDQLLPATVPVEGAGSLCNFQLSVRPSSSARLSGAEDKGFERKTSAEVLTFNSGGAGARPRLDGLNATAFPSGVMTMPVEATENDGPVVIWEKQLRTDSGGVGQFRGGLGQCMQVSALPGYEFDFLAMFDRAHHPARGRHGGGDGAPTVLLRDDGETLKPKGRQFVPEGVSVQLKFPGGGGYGDPKQRDPELVERDLRRGYISAEVARDVYGLSAESITELLK